MDPQSNEPLPDGALELCSPSRGVNWSEIDAPPPTSHFTAAPGASGEAPVVLLLIGSFSPITYMHLRLLELARETCCQQGRHVLGGIISPTADAYGKPGLVSATDRVQMATLASKQLTWTAVDSWEASQQRFVYTYEVVERIQSVVLGEVWIVCGGDLVQSMAEMEKWSEQSLRRLFRSANVLWVSRGENVNLSILEALGGKFWEMKGVTWDLSSTVVRKRSECVRKGKSILFMTPTPVVEYISEKRLFV